MVQNPRTTGGAEVSTTQSRGLTTGDFGVIVATANYTQTQDQALF